MLLRDYIKVMRDGGSSSYDLNTVQGRKRYIWDRLKANNFSDLHASAIMGNLQRENDTFDPTRKNEEGSGAYGIAQWLGSGRLGRLRKEYKNPGSLESQVDFLIKEITDPSYFNNSWLSKENYNKFFNTGDLAAATYIFSDDFERAGAHEKNNPQRVQYSANIYKEFTGQDVPISDYGTNSTYAGGNNTSHLPGRTPDAPFLMTEIGLMEFQEYRQNQLKAAEQAQEQQKIDMVKQSIAQKEAQRRQIMEVMQSTNFQPVEYGSDTPVAVAMRGGNIKNTSKRSRSILEPYKPTKEDERVLNNLRAAENMQLGGSVRMLQDVQQFVKGEEDRYRTELWNTTDRLENEGMDREEARQLAMQQVAPPAHMVPTQQPTVGRTGSTPLQQEEVIMSTPKVPITDVPIVETTTRPTNKVQPSQPLPQNNNRTVQASTRQRPTEDTVRTSTDNTTSSKERPLNTEYSKNILDWATKQKKDRRVGVDPYLVYPEAAWSDGRNVWTGDDEIVGPLEAPGVSSSEAIQLQDAVATSGERTPFVTTRVKNRIISLEDYNAINNTDEQYWDADSPFAKMQAECSSESNGECLSSVLNYDTSYLAPDMGVDPIRIDIEEMYDDYYSQYSIPSKSWNETTAEHNTSVDSWEFHEYLRGTQDYLNLDGQDLYTLPLGTVIGTGDSSGTYTNQEDGSRPRHSIQVVGYTEDGMPLVNSMGTIFRIDEYLEHSISDDYKISVPREYADYTFEYITKGMDEQLGVTEEEVDIRTIGNPEYAKGVNKIIKQLALETGVPVSFAEKVGKHLEGLINQESYSSRINIGGVSPEKLLLDNDLGNLVIKPAIKMKLNDVTTFQNTIKKAANFVTGGKELGMQQQLYKLEQQAAKEFPDDKETQRARFNQLKEENDKKLEPINTDLRSSRGLSSIKDYSPLMQKILGKTHRELQSGIGTFREGKAEAAQAAMIGLIERAKVLRRKYPELNDEQLIDLAYVAYSNNAKWQDPSFVQDYIVDRKLEDDLLQKIKLYQ